MTTFVTLPSQLPGQSCDTLTEDGMLVCAPERPPPRMRFGSCPSPYRVSDANAFADINRALDIKSLRDSVRRGPYASQLPPSRVRNSVHLGPSPTTSPPFGRNSVHIASPSSLSVALPERPKSFIGNRWRTKVDEHEEKPLLTGAHTASKKQTGRSVCKGIKALAGIVKGLGKHKEAFVHEKLTIVYADTLLALAENSLRKGKKPLNISAIVKDAERRAHEQGRSLGVQARTRIKKAVEKLGEHGALTEAPRKSRAPVEYSLTPKAAKVYKDAKAHRRSDVGIAKEMSDTLKGNERPAKRRRSSVSVSAGSTPRITQQVTVEKLKAELAAARSEIKALKRSNQDLLDQQLDSDDDYDSFGSPTRKALSSQRVEIESPLRPFLGSQNHSFLGGRPTRPTTPEPTEYGSPEYEPPTDFDFAGEFNKGITPSSSPPDAVPFHVAQDSQVAPEKSEIELKLERFEASMSELTLEKAQMAEEIATLKNQVQHERDSVTRLTQEKHEAELVQVELAQISKDRDHAHKRVSHLERTNADLETQYASLALSKEQLEVTISHLRSDIQGHIATQSEIHGALSHAAQELETTKASLSASQIETSRLTESLAMAEATAAVLNSNILARDSTILELENARTLFMGQIQTLRSEAQTLRDNIAIAHDRALKAEHVATERNSQIAGMDAEQEALQATIEGLEMQRYGLASENSALARQIEESNTTVQSLSSQITNLSAETRALNTRISELELTLDAVRAENNHLRAKAEADNSEATRFISQRDTTIASLEKHVGELESQLKDRVQQLSTRQEQIIRLNTALAESATKVVSLEKAKKAISEELSSSVDEIGSLNGRITELRNKEQANLKRIRELSTSLTQHKDSLEEHQDLISKLELQLDKLRNIELQSLRKRRARFEAEARRLKDEEDELTQETIDVDQWDEGLSQSRVARASLAPSFAIPSSP